VVDRYANSATVDNPVVIDAAAVALNRFLWMIHDRYHLGPRDLPFNHTLHRMRSIVDRRR
jgi:hypothetical protein